MTIIAPPDEGVNTPPATCPTCAAPATSEGLRQEDGRITGYYCCGSHIWITTWLAVAA